MRIASRLRLVTFDSEINIQAPYTHMRLALKRVLKLILKKEESQIKETNPNVGKWAKMKKQQIKKKFYSINWLVDSQQAVGRYVANRRR